MTSAPRRATRSSRIEKKGCNQRKKRKKKEKEKEKRPVMTSAPRRATRRSSMMPPAAVPNSPFINVIAVVEEHILQSENTLYSKRTHCIVREHIHRAQQAVYQCDRCHGMCCLCLVYVWFMSGLCVVYVSFMRCLCVVYVSFTCCLCVVYVLFMCR